MIAHIAWREFRSLFLSPFAWCVLATVQALMAFVFLWLLNDFQLVQPQLLRIAGAPGITDQVVAPMLGSAATLLLVVVPLLTMRSVADERRSGTLLLLRAAPVAARELVLGKYLALLGLLAVLTTMLLLMPLSLAAGTTLDWGKLAAGTLGLLLAGAAFTAAGLFVSTLTAQPALAAFASLGLLLAFWFVGLAGDGALAWLSTVQHQQALLRGAFSSADLVYFALFIATFLWLAVHRLDGERRA